MPGARVYCNGTDRTRRNPGSTDERGAYEVLLAEAEAKKVRAVVAMPRAHLAHAVPCAFDATALAARELEVDLQVEDACRLRVRVLDEGRMPIAGALIRVTDRRRDWGRSSRFTAEEWNALGIMQVDAGTALASGETDEDGICMLENVPCEASLLTVWCAGYVPTLNKPIGLPGTAPGTIELTLLRGMTLSGWVVDSEGRGVDGATVFLAMNSSMGRGATDARGRFSVSGMAQGMTAVSVACTHEGFAPFFRSRCPLDSGDELRIELSTGSSLDLLLVDEITRAPLTGEVEACYTFDTMFTTIRSELIAPTRRLPLRDGAVRLERLSESIETIWIDVPSYDPYRIVASSCAEQQTLVIAMSRTRDIRLTCVDDDTGDVIVRCYGSGAASYELDELRKTVNQFELSESTDGVPALLVHTSDLPYEGDAVIRIQAVGYEPVDLSLRKADMDAVVRLRLSND